MTQARKRRSGGNALFMILIAVFLLGSLTALVVRSSTTSDDTGDTEKSRIAATEIMRYGSGLKAAVDNLLLRGCSESELNFHSSILFDDLGNNRQNTKAAPKNTCDLYHEAGTGLQYYILPEAYYYDAANAPYHWYTTSATHASYDVAGTPSNTSDLVWYVYNLRKDICVQINKVLGIALTATGDPFADSQDAFWEYYMGQFRTGTDGIAEEAAAGHHMKKSGCFETASGNYTFYMLLIGK